MRQAVTREAHVVAVILVCCIVIGTLSFLAFRSLHTSIYVSLPVEFLIGFGVGYAVRRWL